MSSGWQDAMCCLLTTDGPPQRQRSSWGSPPMTRRLVGMMASERGGSFAPEMNVLVYISLKSRYYFSYSIGPGYLVTTIPVTILV